jgi:hypothetical protein
MKAEYSLPSSQQPTIGLYLYIYIHTHTHTHTHTGMRRLTTFRSKTDRIYDGGPILF